MTLLRRGITGFRDFHEQTLPQICLSDLKACCFNLGRAHGYLVRKAELREDACNFHAFTLQGTATSSAVVCNNVYPVIAFVETLRPGEPLKFVQPVRWNTYFPASAGWIVPALQQLTQPISTSQLSDLSQTEISQIRYWQPQTVGEAIFNWWD